MEGVRILINGGAFQSDVCEMLVKYPEYAQYLGWFNTPRTCCSFERWRDYRPRLPIAVDNAAYVKFNAKRYRSMIERIEAAAVEIEWITVQDSVGNADLTLYLFEWWEYELRKLPLALVGQDRMEDCPIPWNRFQCFFIGGSTEWKLSRSAADLVTEAKKRGKTVHMGRVNSDKRLKYAYELGCDSVDGTGYSQWTRKYLLPALHYMHGLHMQTSLF